MKPFHRLLICFLPFLLPTGCDVEYRDEDEDSSVYVRVTDSTEADLHTVYGGIEVVDDFSGVPVSNSEISVEVRGDGQVRDAFRVVTGPEGVTRFEITVESPFRPYDRMTFRVRHPLYETLSDSIPIEETSVIPDGNGFFLTIYEADAVVRLDLR